MPKPTNRRPKTKAAKAPDDQANGILTGPVAAATAVAEPPLVEELQPPTAPVEPVVPEQAEEKPAPQKKRDRPQKPAGPAPAKNHESPAEADEVTSSQQWAQGAFPAQAMPCPNDRAFITATR